MAFKPMLGRSDFREFRRLGGGYVDKSRFIWDVIDDPFAVLLLPRPRRFGKTTNLSMLRYFLEKSAEDRADLFQDLEIWRNLPARAHYQRYPVLWLTFKDVKFSTVESALEAIRKEIQHLFHTHRYLLDEGALSEEQASRFRDVLRMTGPSTLYSSALRELSEYLARWHGAQTIILIDEYDTPIHAAYVHGYYDPMIEFMRAFLSGGLKDNPNLFKGVITGILRVSKESLFSGLNNIEVYSMLRPRHAASFGFTEEEVGSLCDAMGLASLRDGLQDMYNGYLAAGLGGDPIALYNPWSVLSCLADERHLLRPYWVNTASDDLIRMLLLARGYGLNDRLERLLRGEVLEEVLDDNIVFRDLERREDAVWSFLWASGYLKASRVWLDDRQMTRAELAIPNREVKTVYQNMFLRWIEGGLSGSQEVERMLKALLTGDVERLEEYLGAMLLYHVSSHDPAGRAPEKLYHGFILGLLVYLEPRFEVRSNPESGYGRADLLVCPRQAGQPGVVMELKVLRPNETVKTALRKALDQIEANRYAAQLEKAGAGPIHRYAALFDGKLAHVVTPESWEERFGS